MNEREAILAGVASVMASVFHPPAETVITRETSASDIDGWDSLSHSMLILHVEEEFGVELPVERLYALRDVGELVDLIAEVRPTVVVYGNCQAEGLAQVLRCVPLVAKRYRVLYVPSYDRPGGAETVERADIERCDVLFEQHDPRRFPHACWLRGDCRRVTFPSLDFNLLWPFSCPNPYNEPEPPVFPHGRFPYGHGVVVGWIDRGMTADETLAAALAEPEGGHRPNLDRLYGLENARLRAREAHCDVKIADYVFENFRSQRLFWAIDHPTNLLFAELCLRLLAAAFPAEADLQELDMVAVLTSFGTLDLLGAISVPVDPWVARHLELAWYDPEETYRLFHDEVVAYEEFYRRMIDTSLAIKHKREAPAASLEIGVE